MLMPLQIMHQPHIFHHATYSQQLVRLKGIIYTLEYPEPLVVQGAAGRLYPPTFLSTRESDDGVGRLVFIADGEMTHLTEELMAQLPA